MVTAEGWYFVGVDYCTMHHGIRNEDDQWCDFREDVDENLCETCDGEGEHPDPNGRLDSVQCDDCEGFGYSPCVLRPLAFQRGEATA